MVAAEGYSIIWVQRINATYTVSLFEELGIIRYHYKLDPDIRFWWRRRLSIIELDKNRRKI
jgi:hypothetical protein